MVYSDTVWAALEQWSPIVFLLAGGLFALLPVASGLTVVTGLEITVSPAIIFMFMLVVFVGLLGQYRRLADRNARLAQVGVGLLAGTVAIIIPAVGIFMPATGLLVGEATALGIVVAVAVGSTLTVTTFGVATLWTGTDLRPIGGYLLLLAASMAFMIVAMVAYGHSTPSWVSPVVNGLAAMSLGAIGSVLRSEDILAASTDSTGDVTAS